MQPEPPAERDRGGSQSAKQSTGSVVSSPAAAGVKPRSARSSPRIGATAEMALRRLSATSKTATSRSSGRAGAGSVTWGGLRGTLPVLSCLHELVDARGAAQNAASIAW